MADPISVQCPHCKVKLKLKAAPPAGKKIGCPKCKKPFPMKDLIEAIGRLLPRKETAGA